MALNFLPFLNDKVTKPTGHEPFTTFTEKYASLAQNYDGLPYIADTRPTFAGSDKGPRALITKPTPHPPALRSQLPLPFHTTVYNANALHVADLETMGAAEATRRAVARERAIAAAYVPQPKKGIGLLYNSEVAAQQARIAERTMIMRREARTEEEIASALAEDHRILRSLLQKQAEAEAGVAPTDVHVQRLMSHLGATLPSASMPGIRAAREPLADVMTLDDEDMVPVEPRRHAVAAPLSAVKPMDGMAGNNPTPAAQVPALGEASRTGPSSAATPAVPPGGVVTAETASFVVQRVLFHTPMDELDDESMSNAGGGPAGAGAPDAAGGAGVSDTSVAHSPETPTEKAVAGGKIAREFQADGLDPASSTIFAADAVDNKPLPPPLEPIPGPVVPAMQALDARFTAGGQMRVQLQLEFQRLVTTVANAYPRGTAVPSYIVNGMMFLCMKLSAHDVFIRPALRKAIVAAYEERRRYGTPIERAEALMSPAAKRRGHTGRRY